MARIQPLAVRRTTAAAMLDMSPAQFDRLVSVGALPGPAEIGDDLRWRVSDLEAVLSGDAARETDDIE